MGMQYRLHFICGVVGILVIVCGCGTTGSAREYARGLVEELKLELDSRFRKIEADVSAIRRRVEGPGADLAQIDSEIAALRTLTAQERVELKADLERLTGRLGKLQAQLIALDTRLGTFENTLGVVLKAQREALDKALFELRGEGRGSTPGK